MTLQWPSPAKLNLFLYITGRRTDGYHLLQTLFQFLDYSDILTITPTTDGRIRLLNSITGIMDKDNLIIRAAKLLQRYCWAIDDPTTPGADIQLEKNLPIGSGLGGGSSNAATTLVALNFQWNCRLSINILEKLGLMLGADIPVFIHGKVAFAEGVGDLLTFITLTKKWYLVMIPPVSITTSRIFSDPNLKRNTPLRPLSQLMTSSFYNDCEPVVKKHFSSVKQHLSWLLTYKPSRLTGTGACIFAEFETEASAKYILAQAPIWMRGFIAQGVNISPLYRTLLTR